jgi:hypothetical protein
MIGILMEYVCLHQFEYSNIPDCRDHIALSGLADIADPWQKQKIDVSVYDPFWETVHPV